jgi:hypothetical protein
VIILPLIERELRARARNRATYWTRFSVALAGLVFCLPLAELSGGVAFGPKAMGHSVFTGIVRAAFILSCCAGFVTVDSISRERRDGTLGLLYLTRVKALDVLLGSFGAAGINCVCALMAFLPVVMLPVLTGGVTGGEAFRTMLVLLDTLLLSLAAGLWAAGGARGWFKSARALVGMLALIIITGRLFPWLGPGRCVLLLSPLTTLNLAADASYAVNSEWFWISLAAVLGISCLLLIAAGFRLRRAMREGLGMTESFEALRTGRLGEASLLGAVTDDAGSSRAFTLVSWKIRFPGMRGTDDPVRWLVRRQRGMKAVIWVATVIRLLGTLPFVIFSGWFGLRVVSYGSTMNVTISLVTGSLLAWAASRFFVEARRNGGLELLLTTPVGAKTIVASQWKELKRLFFAPVAVLAISDLIYVPLFLGPYHMLLYYGHWIYGLYLAGALVLTPAGDIIGLVALIWAGLWFGLTARSRAGPIICTVLLVRGVAWGIGLAGSTLLTLCMRNVPALYSFWLLASWLPQIAILLYSLWLIRWARRRLAGELRDVSTVPFTLGRLVPGARAGVNAFVEKARRWPAAPEG